jgi:hypothetical protein
MIDYVATLRIEVMGSKEDRTVDYRLQIDYTEDDFLLHDVQRQTATEDLKMAATNRPTPDATSSTRPVNQKAIPS